ncbi:MAG: multi-copper polyphenol oxidoreductase [Marinobacter sp. 34-60-7]|nr:MAG: multi-copper polyphenol oxidoreductase [Marinobacter sp. 34-60-7]
MISDNNTLRPSWNAPDRVRALSTTRRGGVSGAPWESLNLGHHVDDVADHVAENRQRLAQYSGLLPEHIGWLNQVHGTDVVELDAENVGAVHQADASFTRQNGIACAILTADCLPVVLADNAGTVVGAAHAGWRSLCGGVIEHLIAAMQVRGYELTAWLGPAIGPDQFEVGPEVREAFLKNDSGADAAFATLGARPGHYLADIYTLARRRLARAGVANVSGGSLCTVNDKDWFFSYRRDGQTGRMATLVWIKS